MTIYHSQGLWLRFSLWRHFSQYMVNVVIYSVGRDMMYQIWQNSNIKCFVGIWRESLTREILAKISYHHLSWLFAFQSCAKHMLHFTRRLLASYPRKLLWSSICFKPLHSFSHTTLTMKSHINYRVQNIEQNYNQIWHGIKANAN